MTFAKKKKKSVQLVMDFPPKTGILCKKFHGKWENLNLLNFKCKM